MSSPDLAIACACGAPSTVRYEMFDHQGDTILDIDACQPCGELYQAECAEMHAQRCEMERRGVDKRMIDRIIAERVERKELLGSIPFPGEP